MDYKLEIIRDVIINLKLKEICLQSWNYKRHGYKLEIIRDMVTNLKLYETW